jgi:hypothetical protein
MPIAAPVAAALIGSAGAIGGGLIASHGASKAANIQNQADQAAIGEQQRQFNVTDQELAPFRQAGLGGLAGYGDLVGTNGGPQQAAAIQALQASPFYQSLYNNGLEATLQNASATGGIRGGNTQLGLARFGSDTLAQVIQQQLGNLGALANMGLGATNSTGAFGAAASNNIANLTQQQGQNSGDAALAQAGAMAGIFKNIGSLAGFAVNPSAFGAIPASSVGNSGGINVTPNGTANWYSAHPVGGF